MTKISQNISASFLIEKNKSKSRVAIIFHEFIIVDFAELNNENF